MKAVVTADGTKIEVASPVAFAFNLLVDRDATHPSARFPFAYIHSDCGYPAFYVRRLIFSLEALRSADVAQLDGSPMPPYAATSCGHCGGPVRLPLTRHIQELLPS